MIASARGQSGSEAAAGKPNADQPAGQSGKLDRLLDLADKDVGQLPQVKVGGQTGSPSLDTPVSSVSRQESTVGHSPAAVFVITNEMIRRSGAKEIPEVLRMVPGIDVAKIDSNKWAVTSRGFNGRFANSLLVRIDGRDVYTPLFGGTFWDVQDVLLEDVERIEVIRGPGATIWGANAVNGVINIITKNAKNTQGVYVESGAGTYEKGYTSARYGGKISDDLNYRVYGKWFDRGSGFDPDGAAYDAWNQTRGGFRMDWNASPDDIINFQGDYYNGYSGDEAVFADLAAPPSYYDLRNGNTHVTGDDVVASWKRVLDDETDWTAKIYYDQTQRHWPVSYGAAEDRNTFDFDFQYRFPLADRHAMICGLECRNTQYSITANDPAFSVSPSHRSDNLYSCFAQDEITLREDLLYFTVGSKFEQNDYTGFEFEPSARLLLTPDKKHSLWASVSRAVRTPTCGECFATDILPPVGFQPMPSPPYPPKTLIPIFPVVYGNTNLLSEELMAYEAGIRGQPTDSFSWDLAVFFNNYQRLATGVPGTPIYDPPLMPTRIFIPTLIENAMTGNTYGFELSATCKVTERWRLQPAYTFLIMDLRPVPGSTASEDTDGSSPRNEFYLQSSWDLGDRWELDVTGRYVDSLPAMGVPKYIVGDIRLAWHANKNLEFSVVGRNLFNGSFYEFGNDSYMGAQATEVQSEVYGQVAWRH